MKTRTRLIILARLELVLTVLAMLGTLPMGLALETFSVEGKRDGMDCAAGSCSGGFTLASADPTGIDNGDVAWGDYDDDGDLDILLAGDTGSVRVTEVWRNDGGGTFTLASTDPTGVYGGDVAWGDYDDDGDLDILLAGDTSSARIAEVWRNDGGGSFTLASNAPTGVSSGGVAWGDYDDDGDLDILLAGDTGVFIVTEVWRNDGGGTFTLASTDPTGVYSGDVAWGDYDDDGDLDILLAGRTDSVTCVTEVWRNDGGDTFTKTSAYFTGVCYASVAWGGYDDDGDLDILLAGQASGIRVTEVWRNDGGDTFTLASTDPTGFYAGDVAWADYDDDGDLDILLAGHTGSGGLVTEVWRNDGSDTFTLVSSDLTGVFLSSVAWGDYDDDGDLDILLAGDAGSENITEVWRNETCRCSGSTFTQTNIALTGVDNSSVAWGDYDDDGDLDILLAGYTGSAYVTQVWRNDGGGTFTQASVALTGIRLGSVAWGDYDHDGDLDILLAGATGSTTRTTEVWRNNDNGTFTQISTAPTGVSGGGAVWGDYDDDNDLDILLTGHTGTAGVTEVWRNDGGTFVQTSIPLTGISNSSVAWGDYDDDGDLDILLAGYTGSATRVAEVWRNDEGTTFVQVSAVPTGVSNSSVAWGDYDDDGDLDILLAGITGSTRVAEVWRNDGSGTFTQASVDPTGVSDGSVVWGDYDDDGDLDILLTGSTGSVRVTEIWENDGGIFTLAIDQLTGVSNSDVAWGDYDDDGDLDILLTGSTGSARVTEVWRSECFQVFLPLTLQDS